MIFPTLKIERRPFAGNDVHGQPTFGAVAIEWVAPVRLSVKSQHTTVRTDSSGSHGSAYERVADMILMAKPMSPILIGDKLTVVGQSVRVIKRDLHYLPNGRPDHIELHCDIWRQ